MVERARRYLDVREGEGSPVAFTFLFIALAVASFTLAKPIRTGLFLAEFGAYKLAYAYVAVPLVLAVLVPVYQAVAARVGQRLVFTGSLVFLCANVLAFWWALRYRPAPWQAAAFYVWVNCYGVIAPVQAWSFASAVFDTRQARRLFGPVGSGASFGAIVGGLMARMLVEPIGGTVNLLLVLAALIAAAAVLVNLAWRVRRPDLGRGDSPHHEADHPGDTWRLIRQSPYLRLLAALVFLVAIVTQWSQFQLTIVAQAHLGNDRDAVTSAFGLLNFVMGILAFAVQILATGPLLRNFGIALTILVLPLALGFGSLLTVLWPVWWTVLLTNCFDQGFRYSVDRATFELLYLPLSPDVRGRVKNTIDLVINRFADGVGGVVLLLATQGISVLALTVPGLHLGVRGLATMSLAGTFVWLGVAWALRRGYVDAIRDSIQQHRLDATRAATTVLDRTTTDLLAGKLQEGSPDEILYALGLFEMEHRGHLHPAVRGLLTHESPAVRRRALALLDEAGEVSVVPQVEQLLRDPDIETRTDALMFLARHTEEDPLQRLRRVKDFPEYSIQAAMVGFLSRSGPLQNLDAAAFLLDNLTTESAGATPASRLEAARLLAKLPGRFDEQFATLLDDRDPEVCRAAIHAAAESDRDAVVPRLIELVGHPEFTKDAAAALIAIGPLAVTPLSSVLEDEGAPKETRREIPAVLASIGTAEAQQALQASLLAGDVSLRLGVIAALGSLKKRHPELPVDRQTVEMVLGAEIMGHYRSYQILGTVGSALVGNDPVIAGLRHSMEQEVQRIFRLTGLLGRADDIESAYEGLSSTSATVRANALELLDNVLSPDLRRLLVPLVDPQVAIAERVALAAKVVGAPVESREQAVQALMASDDPWLRSCGVYAVGALRLSSLAGDIERFDTADDPLLRETVRAARLQLAAQPQAQHRPGGATPAAHEEAGAFDLPRDGGGVG